MVQTVGTCLHYRIKNMDAVFNRMMKFPAKLTHKIRHRPPCGSSLSMCFPDSQGKTSFIKSARVTLASISRARGPVRTRTQLNWSNCQTGLIHHIKRIIFNPVVSQGVVQHLQYRNAKRIFTLNGECRMNSTAFCQSGITPLGLYFSAAYSRPDNPRNTQHDRCCLGKSDIKEASIFSNIADFIPNMLKVIGSTK